MADSRERLLLLAKAKAKAQRERGVDGGVTNTPYVGGEMQDTRSPEAKIPDFTQNFGARPPSFLGAMSKIAGLPQPENIQRSQYGFQQARENNPLAGGQNLGLAAINQGMSPLQGIDELMHLDKTGVMGGVADVVGAPIRAIGQAFTSGSNALFDAARQGGYIPNVGVIPPNFGMNERQNQELRQVTGEAAATVGSVAVPEAIGRGVARTIRNAPARGISKGMELFDEALPPSSKEFTRPKDLRNMIPYMKEELKRQNVSPGNRENSVVRQTDERVFKNIEDRVYKTRQQFIERNAGEVIPNFGNQVSDAVTKLRNVFTENIDLLKDQSIIAEAEKWQRQGSITLKEATEFQRHLNDNLRELYKKTMSEQISIEGAAKPIAELEKAAGAIREIIVDKLNDVDGSGNYYRKLSEDYGSASKLRFAAERNKVVSEKPVPPILERFSERIGTSGNVYATAKPSVLFPKFFNSNRKLQSAFGKFMKYGGDIIEPRLPERPSPTGGGQSPISQSRPSPGGSPTTPPSSQVRIFKSTPEAVAAGENMTAEQAKTYLDAYKSGKRTAPPKNREEASKFLFEAGQNQYNREAVEGFIAKKLGTKHIPYAKLDALESAFNKAISIR